MMIVSDNEKKGIGKDGKEMFSGDTAGLHPEVLLEYALTKKEEGNVFFKEKEYYLAIGSYSKAIEICPNMQGNNDYLVSASVLWH